jgi:hypothetical protein
MATAMQEESNGFQKLVARSRNKPQRTSRS